jgi:quercetin dioxygenase-like cupin family protein
LTVANGSFTGHNTGMSTTADTTDLSTCYPEGAPEGFPVELFAPTQGGSLFIREANLRKKIDQLQGLMEDMPQAETPVVNTFAGGVYARELFIPKGTILVGKVHLTEHLNICLKGDLTFLTVDGPKRVVGPTMFAAPAGTKKLAYANEDSIWVNVHPALSDDPDQIVDALTVSRFADFDRLMSKADLEHKVAIFGYTPESMHAIAVDPSTLDETPMDGVFVADSELHGQGLFASKDFLAGDTVCLAMRDNKRTLAGRYSNHSPTPSAAIVRRDDQLVLVTLHDVQQGDELTTDYGETLALIAGEKEFV